MDGGNKLSQHILPTSAQLVGVCVTVISLIKALHIGQAGMIIDKLLAINCMLFTVSALLSYASIRGYKAERMEGFADQFFMLGLIELGGCAVLLAFEIV
ncbi:MAG: hypothetical protein Q7K26_03985 [bacterium]|nr:hypothetical protein [bacterium]